MLGHPRGAQGQVFACLFLPLPCDLVFGLDTKAIWGLDSCQVKGQLSHPSCLHVSPNESLSPFSPCKAEGEGPCSETYFYSSQAISPDY